MHWVAKEQKGQKQNKACGKLKKKRTKQPTVPQMAERYFRLTSLFQMGPS